MSDYLPSFIVEPVLRQARRFSERGALDKQAISASVSRRDRLPLTQSLERSLSADVNPANNRFGFPTLPQFPAVSTVDFQRFYPSRFWNQSPPPSTEGERGSLSATAVADEVDSEREQEEESTLRSIARNVQLWANQLNDLDVFPSPPLQPVAPAVDTTNHVPAQDNVSMMETDDFPLLDTEVPQQPPPRSHTLDSIRSRHSARNDSETSLNPAIELSYRSRAFDQRHNGRSYSDPSLAPNVGQDLGVTAANADNDGLPERVRDWSGPLAEDDGMGPLRKKINDIWSGPETPQEKSRMVHVLMTERYRQGQNSKAKAKAVADAQFRPTSPSSISTISYEGIFNLTPADLQPTYAPVDPDECNEDNHHTPSRPSLGCVHYQRNVKMQCSACEKWYTCRLCHDEVEDHELPRRETRHMLCMICSTPQTVGQDCRMCGTLGACYYCAICKLWNNDPAKAIYHCDDCGICRLGEGLGKDFFHCKTCAACMAIEAESRHRCIERSTKCDCPICGEYMFTSNLPVAFMRCGHSIHETCFRQWCNTSYKCPMCSKSIANMESQFRRLDRYIEEQPMPDEHRGNRAYIFCNDCSSRSVTKFHWLGLKCAVCDSYNTVQLELLGIESPQIRERIDQAQQLGVGEAGITASQSHTPTNELVQPATALQSGQTTPSNNEFGPTREAVTAVHSPAATTIRSPPSHRDSPFHIVSRSPSARSGRGASPAVGNYFNTGQNRLINDNRRSSYFGVFTSGGARSHEESQSTSISDNSHPETRNGWPTSPLQHATQLQMPGSPLCTSPLTIGHGMSDSAAAFDNHVVDDEEEELDFWGGQSPRAYGAELVDLPSSSEDDTSDDDESGRMDEDDDDDGDDIMDIPGHL